MQKVVIIGFGRFGQLLANILKTNFKVYIIESNKELQSKSKKMGYSSIDPSMIVDMDYIFLAVPISKFEDTVKKISSLTTKNQIVMDVCSVKVYPAQIMKDYLTNSQILATHPLFGPDSAKDGLNNLKIVLCPIKVKDSNLSFWEDFWESKGVEVIVSTPEDHDKDAVYSLGLTYTIANTISEMNLPTIRFTTNSFNKLNEVAIYSRKDSLQLFHDMLFYNPYFPKMKNQFENAVNNSLRLLNKIEKKVENN